MFSFLTQVIGFLPYINQLILYWTYTKIRRKEGPELNFHEYTSMYTRRQPSLPTLFLFYITAPEIRKGTSELVLHVI